MKTLDGSKQSSSKQETLQTETELPFTKENLENILFTEGSINHSCLEQLTSVDPDMLAEIISSRWAGFEAKRTTLLLQTLLDITKEWEWATEVLFCIVTRLMDVDNERASDILKTGLLTMSRWGKADQPTSKACKVVQKSVFTRFQKFSIALSGDRVPFKERESLANLLFVSAIGNATRKLDPSPTEIQLAVLSWLASERFLNHVSRSLQDTAESQLKNLPFSAYAALSDFQDIEGTWFTKVIEKINIDLTGIPFHRRRTLAENASFDPEAAIMGLYMHVVNARQIAAQKVESAYKELDKLQLELERCQDDKENSAEANRKLRTELQTMRCSLMLKDQEVKGNQESGSKIIEALKTRISEAETEIVEKVEIISGLQRRLDTLDHRSKKDIMELHEQFAYESDKSIAELKARITESLRNDYEDFTILEGDPENMENMPVLLLQRIFRKLTGLGCNFTVGR